MIGDYFDYTKYLFWSFKMCFVYPHTLVPKVFGQIYETWFSDIIQYMVSRWFSTQNTWVAKQVDY